MGSENWKIFVVFDDEVSNKSKYIVMFDPWMAAQILIQMLLLEPFRCIGVSNLGGPCEGRFAARN
jgi:hypothetical protein